MKSELAVKKINQFLVTLQKGIDKRNESRAKRGTGWVKKYGEKFDADTAALTDSATNLRTTVEVLNAE